jgi:excisionase family DNA binding protein
MENDVQSFVRRFLGAQKISPFAKKIYFNPAKALRAHFIIRIKKCGLRLSQMTILRLANQGFLPGAKIGRQWRFSKEGITALLKHPEILRRVDLTLRF